MSVDKKTIENMLNLALATSLNHLDFYLSASNEYEDPKTRALLIVMAELEEEIAASIEEMMIHGIATAVQQAAEFNPDEGPDETPFDLRRAEQDKRIYLCNKILDLEIKGYTFYLSIAARAKSELISRLFQHLAMLKAKQIDRIRRVCQTF
ncbi:MAG: hypothetical protein QXQ81_00990 [Candidatus Thorarchaeota archaeon]